MAGHLGQFRNHDGASPYLVALSKCLRHHTGSRARFEQAEPPTLLKRNDYASYACSWGPEDAQLFGVPMLREEMHGH